MRRFPFASLSVLTLLLLCACRSDVVVHPPDVSERYVSSFAPPVESYVAMDHADAARSIVSGVGDDVVDGKRWAEQRAVLRFHSIPLGELRFHAEFLLPERLMQQAISVTLNVLFNGESVQQTAYTESGRHEIEKKLAQGDVAWERETEVTLQMIVPEGRRVADGEVRYLLAAAGFRY